LRQAPAPLHVPSVPHDVLAVVAHWLATMGGCPGGIGLQVPIAVGRLHAMHVLSQPVLQQTPCSQ
jgi:hypothetical protein